MNLGTITYVPPKGVLNSDSFYANITKFKAKYPLYLFSDDPRWTPSQLVKWPDWGGKKPAWAINNWLFAKSLQIAKAANLDYWIFCESDSRVGCDNFDEIIFEDFFSRYPNGIATAGSPVCWDVAAGGREFAKRVIEEAWNYQKATGMPMPFYSGKAPMDCSGAAYYANGSLAIYQTEAMLKIFSGFDVDIVHFSKHMTAFDLQLGRSIWNYHRANAIEHVGWLSTCYSAYGNCVTTEKERLQFLADGKFVAVHQVKLS